MAAGLAVAATDVGDVRAMLAPANREFLVPVTDEGALARALARLAGDAQLREAVGAANKARARAEYDEAGMIAAYRAVYAGAMGRASFP
jgi:glycosyltransferase involved in cell wall biosynthesis